MCFIHQLSNFLLCFLSTRHLSCLLRTQLGCHLMASHQYIIQSGQGAHRTTADNYTRRGSINGEGGIQARILGATYPGGELFKDACKPNFIRHCQLVLKISAVLLPTLSGTAQGCPLSHTFANHCCRQKLGSWATY